MSGGALIVLGLVSYWFWKLSKTIKPIATDAPAKPATSGAPPAPATS